MRRSLLCLLAVAAVAAPVASAAPAAGFRDRVLSASARNLDAVVPGNAWGGATTAATGETVSVYVSSSYPQDPAVLQHWADFVASLVHGPELSRMTLFLQTPRQVQRACGFTALACYSPSDGLIVATVEQLPDGPSPESIVAHEYGHHVAASRPNPPWDANDWGPKYWSTALGVCRRTAKGELFPGNESSHYEFNPGEAFAESYRLLNEQRLGLPVSPWDIVDPSLQPDDAALAAVERDVVAPWKGARTITLGGSFRRNASPRPRAFTISTPLDGTIRARVVAPKGATFRVKLPGGAAGTATICGTRTAKVTVERVSGYGAFKLDVTVP